MSEILNISSTDPLLVLLEASTSLGTSDLSNQWLVFLQTELSSSSSDITQLENDWLASATSATGSTLDLWYLYLVTKGYSGTVPDMIFASIAIGDLLIP